MLICEWNNIWHCYAEESDCSPTFDDKIDISLKKLSQITKVSVILDRRTLRKVINVGGSQMKAVGVQRVIEYWGDKIKPFKPQNSKNNIKFQTNVEPE